MKRAAAYIRIFILWAVAVLLALNSLCTCGARKQTTRTTEQTADTSRTTEQAAATAATDSTTITTTAQTTHAGAVEIRETETMQKTFDTLGRVVKETRTRRKTIAGGRTSIGEAATAQTRATAAAAYSHSADTITAAQTATQGETKTEPQGIRHRVGLCLWFFLVMAILALMAFLQIIIKFKK